MIGLRSAWNRTNDEFDPDRREVVSAAGAAGRLRRAAPLSTVAGRACRIVGRAVGRVAGREEVRESRTGRSVVGRNVRGRSGELFAVERAAGRNPERAAGVFAVRAGVGAGAERPVDRDGGTRACRRSRLRDDSSCTAGVGAGDRRLDVLEPERSPDFFEPDFFEPDFFEPDRLDPESFEPDRVEPDRPRDDVFPDFF